MDESERDDREKQSDQPTLQRPEGRFEVSSEEQNRASLGRISVVRIAAEQARQQAEPGVAEQAGGRPAEVKSYADQLEERQRRLWVRIVTVSDFYRMLIACNVNDEEVKEAIIEIGESFTNLRESGAVDEPAIERMESDMIAIEDKLLKLDELIAKDVFQRAANEKRVTAQQLRRYARLLASRPFPIGTRLDRFNFLAVNLLCIQMTSGEYNLLDRQSARAVLRDMVGGLENRISEEEREQTLNIIRDSLDRLSQFKSLEDFFESGYYLDVQGYKLSGRNQLVDPEILYKTVELNAAILNRAEKLRGPQMGMEELAKLLLQQEQEARAILEPKPVVSDISERARASREAAKQKEKKTKRKQGRGPSLSELINRMPAVRWIFSDQGKSVLVKVLIPLAVIGMYLAYRSEIAESTTTATVLDDAPLHSISPVLLQGWKIQQLGKTSLKATIFPEKWNAMEMWERNKTAEQIQSKIKEGSFDTATILLYRLNQKVMEVDRNGVVFMEKR